MPDVATLSEWVDRGESQSQEFKVRTSGGCRREAAETLAAMRNGRGGRVLFGVDKHGAILGQEVSDHTIEEVVAELLRIEPSADFSVDRIRVGDDANEVIAVSVNRGAQRPYVFKGIAYKRIGNSTVAMSQEEHNQMLLEARHASDRWENSLASGWTVDDLDADELTPDLSARGVTGGACKRVLSSRLLDRRRVRLGRDL